LGTVGGRIGYQKTSKNRTKILTLQHFTDFEKNAICYICYISYIAAGGSLHFSSLRGMRLNRLESKSRSSRLKVADKESFIPLADTAAKSVPKKSEKTRAAHYTLAL